MVFASPVFLFLFLPLTLITYFAAPETWRNAILLVASVLFYAWGDAVSVALVTGSIALNYSIGARMAATASSTARKRWLVTAVTVNLIVLAIFKYANFAVANFNMLADALSIRPLAFAAIPLPLGISFFTFHAISYVVDVYKGNASAERNPGRFALYIMLFPQLIAGPIIRWRDIASQLPSRTQRLADVAYGARRFVLGLGKKVLLANTLGHAADRIFALAPSDLTPSTAWLGLTCYTLQIYLDFSGYSDMAIGLMRMFGFHIMENFNFPYVSRSIREFWRRWHISLSNWFRDYLYVPLGGNRRGRRRALANLVVVFLLCGLWHGASWPFVLWGAWHGGFMLAERLGMDRILLRLGPLANVYALLAVMGGWVLFRCADLPHASAYYAALLGRTAGDPVGHPCGEFLDPLVRVTLAAGVVAATPIGARIGRWRDGHSRRTSFATTAVMTLDVAWLAIVFTGASAFLAAGTYNPFIYFRF